MKRKIALAELHQETNSFSKVKTTLREFHGLNLSIGAEEMAEFEKKFKAQIYGFRKAVEKYGNDQFQIVPIYSAWAFSGGPIEFEIYDDFKQQVLTVLREDPEIEGMYFSLHGAMGVDGLRDPESDLMQAIREIKGEDFPLGVSFDLHANVTEENVRLATFINGYYTNPHRDHYKVGFKSGKILVRTLLGEVKPVMRYRKMRLLKGGGWGIDFLPPMRGIFNKMKRWEKRKEVLCVSNFWVHIWIDDPELGWSTVVVTDDNADMANRLAEELADMNWDVRDRKHPKPKDLDEAIRIAKKARIARQLGCVIFCDVSDIVGAGAPGENSWILKGLLEKAPELVSYIPVRDAESAEIATNAGVGHVVDLMVGGKLDPEHYQPTPMKGKVVFAQETKWGKTAIVRHNGVHAILTELAFPAYFHEDFAECGLSLWKADVVVVKNLFPFRFRYWKFNRKTVNVITQGVTNVDVHQLQYTDIPRPIYPLDKIDDWR